MKSKRLSNTLKVLNDGYKEGYAQGQSEGYSRAIEDAAKVVGEHYEDHCCEDCPCDYWRENVVNKIKALLSPSPSGKRGTK